MDEAVIAQIIERAVDRDRRDALAGLHREKLDEVVGPQEPAFAFHDVEHALARGRQFRRRAMDLAMDLAMRMGLAIPWGMALRSVLVVVHASTISACGGEIDSRYGRRLAFWAIAAQQGAP